MRLFGFHQRQWAMIFLRSRVVTPKPRWCWQPAKIAPYESAWCLVHKFCAWNSASKRDLWTVIGKTSDDGPALSTLMTHPQSLLTSDWISTERFAGIFGSDAAKRAFVSYYMERYEGKSRHVNCAHTVRFCERCILVGYHSPLFQLLSVQNCPLHGIPLKNRCDGCDSLVPYCVPTNRSAPPFSCRCGSMLYDPIGPHPGETLPAFDHVQRTIELAIAVHAHGPARHNLCCAIKTRS